MTKLTTVLPTRIVHKKSSGFCRNPCNTAGPAVAAAHALPDAKSVQGQDARFHPRKQEGQRHAQQRRQQNQNVAVCSSFLDRLDQQFADAPFIGRLHRQAQAGQRDRFAGRRAPPRIAGAPGRPWFRIREFRGSCGYSRRKLSRRNPPLTRQRFCAQLFHHRAVGGVLAVDFPQHLARMSSMVTMPAVPPNSSSTMARPRCWRWRLFNNCSRFMLSGTKEGNSMASERSASGSSSKARVLSTPTMVSTDSS